MHSCLLRAGRLVTSTAAAFAHNGQNWCLPYGGTHAGHCPQAHGPGQAGRNNRGHGIDDGDLQPSPAERAGRSRNTVSIRNTLIELLERDPSKGEISAANKAARRIAEDGDAVLISLLPDQADADAYMPKAHGATRRASNYLTVNEEIIKDFPCRIELATEKWDTLIDEGMRLTQQRIESDPVLSAFLPGWKAEQRAEKRARLTTEAAAS